MRKFKMMAFAVACSGLLAGTGMAWDGINSGRIATVEVTTAENYAFRVFLSPLAKMCGTADEWVYLNKSDSNYDTYVSMLMAAKYGQSNVTIYATKDAHDRCKIGHIQVS